MVKTGDALRRARDRVPDLGIHVTGFPPKRRAGTVANDERTLFAASQTPPPSTPVLAFDLAPSLTAKFLSADLDSHGEKHAEDQYSTTPCKSSSRTNPFGARGRRYFGRRRRRAAKH